MREKKYKWYKVAEFEAGMDWFANGIAVAVVRNKKICITKFQNKWFGFAYKCPHAGGILADGYIDIAGDIVCPVHRYKFNIMNGRDAGGEGYYLKIYPVESRPDGIFVGMEDGGLFDWL